MVRAGAKNLITDVPGVKVGHAHDVAARSGVTVVLPDEAATAVVDIRGGAPGTRETDALQPATLGVKADAIVLSGGSAFGLDAASGVVAWLSANGRGFEIRPNVPRVPIVPAAILFDLANGGIFSPDKNPYAELGRKAVASAGVEFQLGNQGAGFGAVAGAYKGGIGSASAVTDDGITVGAIVAVNSVRSPLIPGTDVFWAFPLEQSNEFGGKRLNEPLKQLDLDLPKDGKGILSVGANTTIGVVATDADLTSLELKRVAIMAFDGDTIFALSTAKRAIGENRALEVTRIGSVAADCVARAIARGVYAAETLGPFKSYRDSF